MGLLYLFLYTLVPRQTGLYGMGGPDYPRMRISLRRDNESPSPFSVVPANIFTVLLVVQAYIYMYTVYSVQDESVCIHGLCQYRPCAADRALSCIKLCDMDSVGT
jgi:hypothetical protein